MKKLLLSIVAASFVLAGCNETSNTTPQAKAPVKNAVTKKAPPKKEVWPYIENMDTNSITDTMTTKNYVIVFDDSGSMAGYCNSQENKFNEGVRAIVEFVQSVPEDINLSLYNMNKGFLVPLTKDHDTIVSKLKRSRANGGTPLKSSINNAYNALTKQGKSQLGYGQYGVIIVTDGEANMGEDPTSIVNKMVDGTPIEVHSIGFCLDKNHSLNQVGRTFYTPANNVAQLVAAMNSVLAESNSFDGDFETL